MITKILIIVTIALIALNIKIILSKKATNKKKFNVIMADVIDIILWIISLFL